MPTADMHGGTVEFKDREGRPVAFELVRVGTMKEFETVKAALASADTANAGLSGEKQQLCAKLESADKAIDADQQAHKDAAEERLRLHGLLESERLISKQFQDEADNLQSAATQAHDDLASVRAEIEDLMTAKASLEETNTALEVSQKNLDVERAQLDASRAVNTKQTATHAEKVDDLMARNVELRTERDASRQALADLRAELLTEGNRFKTILDSLAEKIAGE